MVMKQSGPAALGRRRGTLNSLSSSNKILPMKVVVILSVMFVSIFAIGLLVGSHLILSPSHPTLSEPNAPPSSKLMNEAGGAIHDVHKLVQFSAAAEAAKLKEGHLRGGVGGEDGDGVPHPGDKNYNPHHHLDDIGDDGDPDLGDHLDEGEDGGEEEEDVQGEMTADAGLIDPDEDENEKEELMQAEADEKAAAAAAAEAAKEEEEEEKNSQFPYFGKAIPDDTTPSKYFESFQPLGGRRYPEYKDGSPPAYKITSKMRIESDNLARMRRIHVKNAMKHAWGGYSSNAFGKDELLPVTGRNQNNWGGMGTTLVDSLDTLWLMGMKDEFQKARDWVANDLSNNKVTSFMSVFETTIRSLGGLLSAYDWSHDEAFLTAALDLGNRLVKAFDTPSGIPYSQIQLSTSKVKASYLGNKACLAEFGTLQIEFRYLAKATGKKEFATKSERVFKIINDNMTPDGQLPIYMTNMTPQPKWTTKQVSWGAMGDSAYEYMLKIWLQGGRKESMYREMYDKSIDGLHEKLLKTNANGLFYVAERTASGGLNHKMDHLVCFLGGSLALGAYTDPLGLDSERAQRDLKTARALAYTCYQMYAQMDTGISPELVQFPPTDPSMDFRVSRSAPYYILRPETVETFFILNQLTGDPIYREWGWEIFCAIERFCKTQYGYGHLKDVTRPQMKPENHMESFFLAETLKYLYLLQDPDTEVDILNKHVFNTEAHPMRIFPLIDQQK